MSLSSSFRCRFVVVSLSFRCRFRCRCRYRRHRRHRFACRAHTPDCCYKPARFLTPEVEARRTEAWEKKLNSTHDPISFMKLPRKVPETHHTYKESCERALQEPVLTARGRQLVGLDKY
jgi:hypothetical protein